MHNSWLYQRKKTLVRKRTADIINTGLPYKQIISLLIATMTTFSLLSQTAIPLYPGVIPNSHDVANEETREDRDDRVRIAKISVPTITPFLPASDKANGTAVIIFPGGGYAINAIKHEGFDVARKLNEWGIAAFVVKYRVPAERTMPDPSIGPLQDAQQAILMVRKNAKQWNIDAGRIGIFGFSAGGHLASTLGTHFDSILVPNPEHLSARPDFMILAYPVISSDSSIWHEGSFENLLGKNPDEGALLNYSNEKQVKPDTPPSFVMHAADDKTVPVENSIRFFEALQRSGVASELHVYEKGGHGFGMFNSLSADDWMERLKNWLKTHNWVRQ